MSAETMSARWAPETDPLRRPRWPSGQDHENQTILCLIWSVLQPRIKPHHAGFVWPEENCPRLCLVAPKVFYSISVTDGVLGHCRCRLWLAYLGTLGWLHRHCKRAELDDVNTWVTNELTLTGKMTLALLTNNFPVWFCKAALTQSVLYKALYK